MISLDLSGSVLLKDLRSPLPGLHILLQHKGKTLKKISTSITGEDGRFSIRLPNLTDRELAEILTGLSLRVLDWTGDSTIYETDTLSPGHNDRSKSNEILIPIEAFHQHAKDPQLLFFGDDQLIDEAIAIGQSLAFSAGGLIPSSNYVIEVQVNGSPVLSNALRTNNRGEIFKSILWPQLGINDLQSEHLLTWEEAHERWSNSSLMVVISHHEHILAKRKLKIRPNKNPQVFASTKEGRPINAIEAGQLPLYVTILNPPFHGQGRILLVVRQHDWSTDDPIKIANRRNRKKAVLDIQISKENGQSVFLFAKAGQLLPGAYDIIYRPLRYGFEDNEALHLIRRDLISNRLLTGIVIREDFWRAKPVLGGCVNKVPMSGRNISGAPYFEYADTFTVGEDVYAGLDPGIVDPGNISKVCALYVIQSKDGAAWTNNSLNHLPVLGGNASVQKVTLQPGCMNYNKHLLWSNANLPGDYDIIADFGNNTSNPLLFTKDDQYNTPLDMIDGYFVPGFRVVEDPGLMTQWANAGTWHYDENTVNALGFVGSPQITDENGGYFAPGNFIAVNRTVRLQARVFYPADTVGVTDPSQISIVSADYPLIVIVHGNGHDFASYDFLLSHFAKNGFIAVSINCKYLSGANLIHGMSGLGRAEALFKHLQVIYAKFGTSVQNNIGIMGHSRGGEAVLKAARLNNTGGLGYNFNAIMSLAPTDQYGSEILAGAWSKPYFVLYGSRDGDIDGGIWTSGYTVPQTGFALWDRADGSEKAMAFVYLATHNGFVTTNSDSSDPGLLTNTIQKSITQAYMNAYFRMELKNESIWKGMFTGEWRPGSIASTAQIFMQYQDTGSLIIDKFEGLPDWQVSTIGGAVNASGLPVNPEENKLRTMDNHSPHDSQGLKIQWDSSVDNVEFAIPAAQKDVSAFTHLSIRITQKDGSASNPVNLDQNLRISLKDGTNNERAVRVSSFTQIPYPEQRPDASNRKSAMTTVRIPLKSYTIVCAGQVQVNLTDITTLGLKFSENNSGEIEIDTIEFTN